MKIFHSFDELNIDEDTHVTLGKFDGIHLGHMELIKSLDHPVAVFTFDTSGSSELITTGEERYIRFESLGVKYLFECPFTKELMHMEPEVFIEQLIERMHIRSLAVGEDFRFGRDRKGDPSLLKMISDEHGIRLSVKEKLKYEGQEISSSRIRDAIRTGDMELIPHLLGESYYINGKVKHGFGFGHTKDVPTVNIVPDKQKLLPPFGVYFSTVIIDKKSYRGISNLGVKPTVSDSHDFYGLETNIFDFDGDIYDENITVFLHKFHRPEKKFPDVRMLYEQITSDIEEAKKFSLGS